MCNFLVTIITRTSGTPGDAFIATRYAPKPKKSGLRRVVYKVKADDVKQAYAEGLDRSKAQGGTFAFGFAEPA